jgi:hypothetical protein
MSVAQGLLSQMFHIDSFAELMFWCEILTFVYGINVALQNKKTTLVRVTKLSEGLLTSEH